ncbi:MAG: MFS transporter [Actinomycetota bacterium]|nr:MFS transporter [Actinomycetota bacterium]
MPRAATVTDPAGPTAGAGRRQLSTRSIIVVLALCGTLVSLQQTLVLPLLPDFPQILDTSPENASWLVTVTLLTAAVGTPIVSRLADMFGKRLMMIVCLVAVVIGSVVAALSPSLPLVITGRGLAGIGTSLIPVGISIMRDQLPADKVGSGVALMSATLGIGGAVGIPLAGVIYEQLDWHALFWVSGGFAVVMLALVVAVVPESTVRTRGRFDYTGALLLSITLTCFLLAVSKAGAWGWGDEKTIGLLVAAALVFAAWVPLELNSGQPLVDIRTSTRRTVLLTNSASVLIGFAMFTNFLTSAQQVQMPVEAGYGFGLSVLDTGLVMLPAGFAMVAMSPVAAWLIRLHGPRLMLVAGAMVIAVGFVLRVFLHSSVLEVMIASAVSSVGTAVAFAAMPTLIMRSVPITETASANGLNTLLRAIGTSSASATVAAVFSGLAIPVAGASVPTFGAYQLMFWLGTAAALGGATIAGFIRRPAPATERATTPGERAAAERHEVKSVGAEHELIVRGVVTDPQDRPIKQAVVSVLHTDGGHVDWGRTDGDGRFALALPGAARYLVIASADGWGPQSGLVDLDDSGIDRIRMHRRLTLTGQVTENGEPLSGVLLSLIRHSGEYVATGRCEQDGSYEIGLPPPGRYVLTVVDLASNRTRSRAVQVGSTSSSLDIDIVTGIPRPVERVDR